MEFVIWIGLAIAVGFWADSKKSNGWMWGVISLLISPLLGAIIFFLVSLKDQEKAEKEARLNAQIAEAEQSRIQTEAESKLHRDTVSGGEFNKELEKLFALRENGLLTDDEFKQRKRDLILQLASKKPREAPSDFLSTLIPMVKRSALLPDEVAEIKKYIY